MQGGALPRFLPHEAGEVRWGPSTNRMPDHWQRSRVDLPAPLPAVLGLDPGRPRRSPVGEGEAEVLEQRLAGGDADLAQNDRAHGNLTTNRRSEGSGEKRRARNSPSRQRLRRAAGAGRKTGR